MTRKLADTIADKTRGASQAVSLRTARVDSFGSGVATITLAGGSVTDVPYLSTYSPVVGNAVAVLQTEAGQLLILGKPA